MRIVRIIVFILFTILIINQVHAQTSLFNSNDLSQVNIDDYSDDELASMIRKRLNLEFQYPNY